MLGLKLIHVSKRGHWVNIEGLPDHTVTTQVRAISPYSRFFGKTQIWHIPIIISGSSEADCSVCKFKCFVNNPILGGRLAMDISYHIYQSFHLWHKVVVWYYLYICPHAICPMLTSSLRSGLDKFQLRTTMFLESAGGNLMLQFERPRNYNDNICVRTSYGCIGNSYTYIGIAPKL